MRCAGAACLLALGVCAGCAPGGAYFVDQVEDGRAVIVDADGNAAAISASLLPADAGEGAWVGGGAPSERERERIAHLRAELGAADDGRDLSLER